MTAENFPTLAQVEQITANPDAVIRNLQITQCYHELSLALAGRMEQTANWCTFATWASKQAGQTIRKEDLARTLENTIGSSAEVAQAAQGVEAAARRAGSQLSMADMIQFIWKVWDPAAAFERSSDAVARGNRKVFAEIGCEFARFYAACLDDAAFDAAKIAQFCEALRPGEPPQGQEYLRQAFRRYYQALFESDEKTRTELLLLANIEIGFHEQTRLQPEIAEALAAPVIEPEQLAGNLLNALFPQREWLSRLILMVMRLLGRLTEFDRAVEALAAALRLEAQRIVTEYMMTIELPHGARLHLGDDLRAGFPPDLKQIANPDLRLLLGRIDPTPDSTVESGAELWANLPDRLHFIADMFRCYALTPDLQEPPYNQEQINALKEGRLPEGRL
jgi:hypothetical protein